MYYNIFTRLICKYIIALLVLNVNRKRENFMKKNENCGYIRCAQCDKLIKRNAKTIKLLIGAVVLLAATLIIALIRMFIVKGV